MSSMGSRREEMELKSSISLDNNVSPVFSTKKLKNSRKNTKFLFFVFLSETLPERHCDGGEEFSRLPYKKKIMEENQMPFIITSFSW